MQVHLITTRDREKQTENHREVREEENIEKPKHISNYVFEHSVLAAEKLSSLAASPSQSSRISISRLGKCRHAKELRRSWQLPSAENAKGKGSHPTIPAVASCSLR